MKQKSFIIFAVCAIIAWLYCLGTYIFLQINLVPSLAEPTGTMNTLANFLIPAMVLIGSVHLALLIRKLKTLNGTFLDAVFTVMIVLSGIFLLSDITLLSDIGKEYRLFDVTTEWIMLYGFTALHGITLIFGTILIAGSREHDKKLFRIPRERQEHVFLSMHYIALVCGISGMLGIAVSMTGLITPMRFRFLLMGVVSVLIVCPLALIVIYWVISMKKSKTGEWTDEKQRADTGFAATVALLIYLLAMLAILALESIWQISMPVSFWLLSAFFLMLTGFSAVIVAKNSRS